MTNRVSSNEAKNEAHTPGPWKVGYTRMNGYDHSMIKGGNGQWVCTAAVMNDKADIKLICAAPDLLSALQNFVNGVETGAITSDHDETLHNAMIKATAAIKSAREGK